MDHTSKTGESKVLKHTSPLTGRVDRIATNMAVLDVVAGGLEIVELAADVTEDELRASTKAHIVGWGENRAV